MPNEENQILKLDSLQSQTLKTMASQAIEEEGFLDFRFLDLRQVPINHNFYQFLAEGREADMSWMHRTREMRADPATTLTRETPAAIVLSLNYYSVQSMQAARHTGVAAYAQGRDYHNTFRSRLKRIRKQLQAAVPGLRIRIHADSGPLSEKWLAMHAGMGWIGKNTNLISKRHGSFFVLGCMLLNCEFEEYAPHPSHCGTCVRCITHCPTNALSPDGKIDARLCLSWQTIESSEPARKDLIQTSNWLFGCDDCQTACPYNRFSKEHSDADFTPRDYSPEQFAKLRENTFAREFEGSPLKRSGFRNFMFNFIEQVRNRKQWQTPEVLDRLSGHPNKEVQNQAQLRLADLMQP